MISARHESHSRGVFLAGALITAMLVAFYGLGLLCAAHMPLIMVR